MTRTRNSVVRCSEVAHRKTMVKNPEPRPELGQQTISLADKAYELLEERIVTRQLAPGVMLSESNLASELSMGRTPVREALARLEWLGFVEVHARRGVQVSSVDVIGHLELLEVRLPLETTLARHVIERATPADIKELQALADKLSEAAAERNRNKYFRIKRSLHETEVRAAYNPVLTQTMRSLHAQSRRFWFTYERTERFPEAAERHRLIVHYLVKRDAKRAVAAVEALFSFLEAMTKQALERRGPS